jgi:hypothetical protein
LAVYNIKPCYAEGIDMGPCKLYPTINLEERFEDNIFLLPDNEKGDFVTTVTPEILLDFKCSDEKDEVSIAYKYKIQRYDKYKAGNRQNSEFTSKIEFYGPKYFIKAKEKFEQVTEVTSYSEFFNDYNINDALLTLGGEFNNTSFEVTYENLNYEYSVIDNTDDYNEHILDLTGYYNFFPKTKALVEYSFGKLNYTNDATRTGDYNEFLTGIKGELTQKATGTVKVGYQARDYESRKNWNEPVTYINVVYNISEKTKADLTVERKAEESTYTSENFYETNKIGCGLTQELTAKTSFSMDATYNRDKYPATDIAARRDDIWDVKLALDVKTRKWLTWGTSYEFNKRNSSVSTNDYKDNIANIYLKTVY